MPEIKIQGYYPGVVGKITELHAVYYHEHWDFMCPLKLRWAGSFPFL